MEKLKVTLSFVIGQTSDNGLDKLMVTVSDYVKQENFITLNFDLLPSYPLENYVRLGLTKFNQKYVKTQENPPQK